MRTTRSSASRQSSSSLSDINSDETILAAPSEQPALNPIPQRGRDRAQESKRTRSSVPPTIGAPAVVSRSGHGKPLREMLQTSGHTMIATAALVVEHRTMNVNPELIKPPTRKVAKKVSFATPQAVQTPAPKAKDPNHVVVVTESDCKAFFQLSTRPKNRLGHLHTVEIHLNGGQHSEYMDDYLAMALNHFHPRSDGMNPHQLNCLKLVIFGKVFFHRFNYALVSPAVSYEVSNKLHRLMTGSLSIEEKAGLAFKVNSTEKTISKALLGIRGVKNVVIEHQGRAKMEPTFADTIKRTVILPPGVETAPSEIDSATPMLDHEGVSLSQKMRAQELCGKTEYPTRNYKITLDSECGKTRVLVDETIQLLGHFTNKSEETTKLKAMEAAQRVPKRKISPDDYQMIKTTTEAVSLANSNSARALCSAKRRKLDPDTRLADVLAAKTAATAAANLVAAR